MDFNTQKKRGESVYRDYKPYIVVILMATVILTQAVAMGFVVTQPVDGGSGSASAQPSGYDKVVFQGLDDYLRQLDESNGEFIEENPVSDSLGLGGAAMDESTDSIWLGNQEGDNVLEFDASSTSLRGDSNDHQLGEDPTALASKNGSVYVGTESGELRKYNGSEWNELESTQLNEPTDIVILRDRLYIADGSEITVLNKKDLSEIWSVNEESYRLTVDFDGNVYATAENEGVTSYDRDGNERWNSDAEVSTNRYHDISYAVETDRLYYYNEDIREIDPETGDVIDTENVGYTQSASIDTDDETGNVFVGLNTQDGDRPGETFSYTPNLSQRWSSEYGSTGTVEYTIVGYDEVEPPDLPSEFDPELEIDTRHYLKHGQQSPYEVLYTNPDTGEVEEVTDSEDLTVNSSNESVFTLNEDDNLVVATENESINQREVMTAEYEGLETEHNVTVANATVDNLDILPGAVKIEASLTDSTILVIIIGTMAGVVAARVSNAFGGIGALQLSLVMAWFLEFTTLGITLVGLFTALFIGLNLAANINYESNT